MLERIWTNRWINIPHTLLLSEGQRARWMEGWWDVNRKNVLAVSSLSSQSPSLTQSVFLSMNWAFSLIPLILFSSFCLCLNSPLTLSFNGREKKNKYSDLWEITEIETGEINTFPSFFHSCYPCIILDPLFLLYLSLWVLLSQGPAAGRRSLLFG